jgi:periplasmic copper chaperone A
MSSAVRHAFAAAVALAAALAPAMGQEYKAGPIKIESPWIRATPAGAEVAGGYVKIENTGTEADRLIGGSTGIAGKFEIHEMKMEGSIMKMRELPKGLELKPGESVELKPGSYHLMLVGLKQQAKAGDTVKGTLVFEKAGTVEVEYAVRGMGAKGGAQGAAKGGGQESGHGGHGDVKH